jgi:hypothetical protein
MPNVVFLRTPFKIAHTIIRRVTIFVVHLGEVVWIFKKGCGDKTMYLVGFTLPWTAELDKQIPAPCQLG